MRLRKEIKERILHDAELSLWQWEGQIKRVRKIGLPKLYKKELLAAVEKEIKEYKEIIKLLGGKNDNQRM